MESEPSGGPRKIQPPFCWQSKPARQKIRDAFDDEKNVSSALGVYDALTEIASDQESETFQTTHAWIAQKSGFSPRTVQDRLRGLADIGLVKISTPALKCPSTYTILAVRQPLRSDKQPKQRVRQLTKITPLPSLEESNEESLNKGYSKSPSSSKPQSLPPSGIP